jgi:hypothetical protein
LRTRDTVEIDTPAISAMSRTVTRCALRDASAGGAPGTPN